MVRRDIVVIGTSTGGVDALRRLVAHLPSHLPAAVLVVMHMAADSPGYLGEILDDAGPLHAAPAVDGEPLVRNRIYVAVPDRHLMIAGDRIRLSDGPRESHARPSVDVLFRSAASCCGSRVIGIVLTGMLDDGTAGLWAIKDRGGVAIVQSPEEATCSSMPLSAKRHVAVDYTLRVSEIGAALLSLTKESVREAEPIMPRQKLDIENQIALDDNALSVGVRSLGQPSFYTCPECHGSMVAIQDGSFKRFRCHTGHGYTAGALCDFGLPVIENSLWVALAQLEERIVLLQELEEIARGRGDLEEAAKRADEGQKSRQLAKRLRELALDPAIRHSSSSGEQRKSA